MKPLLIILLIVMPLNADVYDIQKGIFISLQITDTYTTIYGLRNGLLESNELVSDLIDNSELSFVASKALYTCINLLLLDVLHDTSPLVANLTLLVINSMHSYYVYKNIGLCFTIKF